MTFPEHLTNPLIIIGGQKCGTTTLTSDLSCLQKLQVDFDEKEASPLLNCRNDSGRRKMLNTLSRNLDDSAYVKLDVSTLYTFYPQYKVPHSEVRNLLPEAKFVYVLRERMSRTLSHFQHDTILGITSGDANEQMTTDSQYVKNSLYGFQLTPWINAFGADRIMLVKFEDYISDRKNTVLEICRFAGIDITGIEKIEGSAIRNESATRLRFPKLLSKFLRSSLYRRGIKVLLPSIIRARLKTVFGSKHNHSKPTLLPGKVEELTQLFENDQKHLESLVAIAPKW